jgi:hypothetical protein
MKFYRQKLENDANCSPRVMYSVYTSLGTRRFSFSPPTTQGKCCEWAVFTLFDQGKLNLAIVLSTSPKRKKVVDLLTPSDVASVNFTQGKVVYIFPCYYPRKNVKIGNFNTSYPRVNCQKTQSIRESKFQARSASRVHGSSFP